MRRHRRRRAEPLFTIISNTGVRLPVVELMTCNTSVAAASWASVASRSAVSASSLRLRSAIIFWGLFAGLSMGYSGAQIFSECRGSAFHETETFYPISVSK